MKKFLLAVGVVFALVAPVWADSTHECQGNSCNGGGAVTNNNTATGGNALATGGTGIGIGVGVGKGGDAVSISGAASGATAGSTSGATANAPASQSVKVKTEVPRQAPAAVAPSLSVSSLTCYGSWGVGVSSPFGGVSGGGPVKDGDCERARNAMILASLGMQDAAIMLLAQNPDTLKAMRDAGYRIPDPGVVSAILGDDKIHFQTPATTFGGGVGIDGVQAN